MKKGILFILFISIFSNSFAQEESKTIPGEFRAGIFYSLNKNLGPDYIYKSQFFGFLTDYDKINYSIGTSIEYEFNNNFSINSGISYSNYDFTAIYYDGLAPFSPGQSFLQGPYKINLRYIEIPLSVRYYLSFLKIKVLADIGIINQFIINGNREFAPGEQFTDKRYISSGKLGIGVEYNINQKYAIQLISQYNQGLTTLFKDTSDFKTETLSFSLGVVKRL
ncbi:outer membrane beta-barrel protein [Aquimarina sp. MMG016]|uniref:outer membrane beta-barrel protein n=1 Tax=Aquimarina sp. MMG016 TaxID=2822690 RepID=UPI001B3A19CA|nr:outer membrane beta-barrel protein [Aquimarina sp. MMG016]MBQ4820286.1 outer membrane beta-barrel protein [Aquimarina sp. MMG016]